jgi:hypothetical protein
MATGMDDVNKTSCQIDRCRTPEESTRKVPVQLGTSTLTIQLCESHRKEWESSGRPPVTPR